MKQWLLGKHCSIGGLNAMGEVIEVIEVPRVFDIAPVECSTCQGANWLGPTVTTQRLLYVTLSGGCWFVKARYECLGCHSVQVQGPVDFLGIDAWPGILNAIRLAPISDQDVFRMWDVLNKTTPGSSSSSFSSAVLKKVGL